MESEFGMNPENAFFYRHLLQNLVSSSANFPRLTGIAISKRWLAVFLTAGGLLVPALAAQAVPQNNDSIQQLAQGLPPLPGTAAMPPSFGENAAIAPASRYMVYVNGSSPLLLEQIQQIEPDAFRRQYDGRTVIQTGAFSYSQNAQAQVAALAEWGIGAEIAEVDRLPAAASFASPPPFISSNNSSSQSVPLPVVAVPNDSVEFGESPLPPPPGSVEAVSFNPGVSDRGYYVVVPTSAAELASTASGVSQLGLNSSQVLTRTSPRGPHVAIGPFSDRDLAQQWNRYLRSYGYNARVHFDR